MDPGYPEERVASIFSLEASIGAGKSRLLQALKCEVEKRALSATQQSPNDGHHRFLVIDEPVQSWTESRYSTALWNGVVPHRAQLLEAVLFMLMSWVIITIHYEYWTSIPFFPAGLALLAGLFWHRVCPVIVSILVPRGDLDTRSILSMFYSDMTRFSFVFQIKAFTSRLQHFHEQVAQVGGGTGSHLHVIQERSLLTDRLFLTNLFESNHVMQVELGVYQEIFDFFTRSVLSRLKTMIYLPTASAGCLTRIRQRGREGEDGIDAAYLESLDRSHRTMIDAFRERENCRVIRADEMADEMSQEQIDAYASRLLDQILARCDELL